MHDELEEEYADILYPKDHEHPVSLDCPFCRGTGVHPATMDQINYSRCPVCGGTGVMKFANDLQHCLPCIRCASSGREPDSNPLVPCSACAGHGVKYLPSGSST